MQTSPRDLEGHARLKRLAHAAFSRDALRNVHDVILPLNDVGGGPAIYSVHSVTGAASNFRQLAAMLGPNQLFFGIQAPTRLRNGRFPSSVEAIAEHYARRLMEFQPRGELVLAGHSVGAVIALEMAQNLRARGRDVCLLAIFDGELFNTGTGIGSFHPLYWWKLARNLPRWVTEARTYFTFESFMRRVLSKLKSWSLSAKAALAGSDLMIGHAVDGFIQTAFCTPDHVAFMKRLYETQYDYFPKHYDGRVIVYVAKCLPLLYYPQVEAAWRKIAPNVEIVHINGSHTSILEESFGNAIAEHLKQTLAVIRGADLKAPAGAAENYAARITQY